MTDSEEIQKEKGRAFFNAMAILPEAGGCWEEVLSGEDKADGSADGKKASGKKDKMKKKDRKKAAAAQAAAQAASPNGATPTMKQATFSAYGEPREVLEVTDAPAPGEPAEDEVVIDVIAASPHHGDVHMVRGLPYVYRVLGGMRTPTWKPGCDLAGRVLRVGSEVEHLRVGDAVFASSGRGALADQVIVKAERVAHMPAGISFATAATVPIAGATALLALRHAGVLDSVEGAESLGEQLVAACDEDSSRTRSEEPARAAAAAADPKEKKSVLIVGAAGGVGVLAVQLANRVAGATVTAVCRATDAPVAVAAGAGATFDYREFSAERLAAGDAGTYDAVIDCYGDSDVKAAAWNGALSHGGVYVRVGHADIERRKWVAPFVAACDLGKAQKEATDAKQWRGFLTEVTSETLATVRHYLASGVIAPRVDSRAFTLEDTPSALQFLADGHARGKLCVRVKDTLADDIPVVGSPAPTSSSSSGTKDDDANSSGSDSSDDEE